MKFRCLDFLGCPSCHGRLQLSSKKVENSESVLEKGLINAPHCKRFCGLNEVPVRKLNPACKCRDCFQQEIVEGDLLCIRCSRVYPIIDCVPCMLPKIKQEKGAEQVRKRFEFQWDSWGKEEKIFGRTDAENTEYVLQGHSRLTPDFFRGKLVLDGGCGHGRFLHSLAGMGAEAIGIDFGSGIAVAAKFNKRNVLVHPIMGDLLALPLQEEAVDYIFCSGVIHHTPNPRQVFTNLAKTVIPGGIMFIWMYPKKGILWEISQKFLRAIFTRLPSKLLYYLCFIPVPLLPFIKTYSSTSLKTASWRQCAQVIFDWYSPAYQFHYTPQELLSWFEEEGFMENEKFHIDTGIAGIKK